jgi:hypothetical protein
MSFEVQLRTTCLEQLKKDQELYQLYINSFDEKTDPFLITTTFNDKNVEIAKNKWISYMLDCMSKGRSTTIKLSQNDPTFKKRSIDDYTHAEMYGRYITPLLWKLIINKFGIQIYHHILIKVKTQTEKDKVMELKKALVTATVLPHQCLYIVKNV